MDGIVRKVGGRFRISLTESTMMKILLSAMDKSHERVKSEEGVILRLTEISKFYELAVMLLDGCLRFVYDEADSNAMEESSDENVLGELAEIRDRLRGRLRETELAIAEKDSEFRRRFGDESPDLKRFDSLGVDFRLEKLKGDGNSEEGMDEEFSELQHSVDQQVMNIKQKLGPEYKMVEKRMTKSLDCLKIDQMSSDIDILKGMMDLAFGKMHSAISLAESEKRGDQQWGWEVERRTTALLMRGIVEDLDERYVSELYGRGRRGSIALNVCLVDLMRCLQDEMEASLVKRRVEEVVERIQNMIGWFPKEEESFGVVNGGIEYDKLQKPMSTLDDLGGAREKVKEEELVTEIDMLRNGKEDLQFQFVTMENTYLAVVEGMLYECGSRLNDHDLEIQMSKGIVNEIVRRSVQEWNQKLGTERIGAQIREDVYRVALSESLKEIASSYQISLLECRDVSNECKLDGELREEMLKVIFRESWRYLNEVVERLEVEELCKEVCLAVFEESLRNIAETGNINVPSSLKCAEHSESSQCLVYSIKEDIWIVFFREMCKRWQDEMDDSSCENSLKEDIFQVLVSDVIREANEIFKAEGCVSADHLGRSSESRKVHNLCQSSDSLVDVKIAELQQGEARKVMICGHLLTDMKSTCSLESSKVKQAMNRLAESKIHLKEIRGGIGIENGDIVGTYKDHTVPAMDEMNLLRSEEMEEVKLTLPDTAFEATIALSTEFMVFQCAVEHSLRSKNLRLQEASRLLTQMAEVFTSLKRKENQYEEAFNRRCENLRKAEIEVDLLGDQVDTLLGVLEKTYQILYHYAPILQQHFEVSDILLMMKRELINQKGSLV